MAWNSRIADRDTAAVSDRVETAARTIARYWSITAIVTFVVLGVTIGVPHGPDLEPWEETVQLVTLGLVAIGAALAWRWEGLGGSVMLVGAAALGDLATLQHQPLHAFIPTVVFLIPAVCFLTAWKRTRSPASLIVLGFTVAIVLGVGGTVASASYQHGYGPSHPQSALPALPDTPVVWMWSGAVTNSSAVVVAAIDGDHATLLLTAEDGSSSINQGTEIGQVWRFELDGLEALTRYTYQISVDGVPQRDREGGFVTFTTDPMSFTVAVGACARLESDGLVYETIAALHPDLFLVTGDWFYADHIVTGDQFADAYRKTLTSPAQAALYTKVPVAYTWDDHDYGGNNSDSAAQSRLSALYAYDTYVPHYPLTDTGGINQAFTIGRVRFILLDSRSSRDPDAMQDTSAKSMLGPAQLDWLEDELLTSSETHTLVVVVTSVPWIAEPADSGDDWGGFTDERRLLANLIADHGIDNFMMVAGDAHMIAIDDGSNTDYSDAGVSGFPLFHAAALDRPGSYKGGPYSEGAIPGGGQFGLITITDHGGSALRVDLAGLDWTGTRLIEYSFEVSTS
jgi:hypothetical protein